MINADELSKLEAVAKAATPGPWTAHNMETLPDGSDGNAWGVESDDRWVVVPDFIEGNDAAFVATFNPSTVLALIGRIREMEWQPIETAPQRGDYFVYQPAVYQPKHREGRMVLAPRVCLNSSAGSVRKSSHWMRVDPPSRLDSPKGER